MLCFDGIVGKWIHLNLCQFHFLGNSNYWVWFFLAMSLVRKIVKQMISMHLVYLGHMLSNIYFIKRARSVLIWYHTFRFSKNWTLNLKHSATTLYSQTHLKLSIFSPYPQNLKIFKIGSIKKQNAWLLQGFHFSKYSPLFYNFFPIINGGHPTHFFTWSCFYISTFLATFRTCMCETTPSS